MIQVNMSEAKSELSSLVKSLETHEEDVVVIARNGKPIVQMTLINPVPVSKRIGIAKGKFTAPDEFDSWDSEIVEMFGDNRNDAGNT